MLAVLVWFLISHSVCLARVDNAVSFQEAGQRGADRARGAQGPVAKAGSIIAGGAEPLLQLKQDLSAVLQESDLAGLIGAQAERNARAVGALEQKMWAETRALESR